MEANRAGLALEVLLDPSQAVDLLLTDVIMPGMSGTRLAREGTDARTDLKVLFMSGHNEEMLSRRAGLEVSNNLLRKPFTPEQLASAVRDALAGPSFLTPGLAHRTAT